jgi:hypothetical protein
MAVDRIRAALTGETDPEDQKLLEEVRQMILNLAATSDPQIGLSRFGAEEDLEFGLDVSRDVTKRAFYSLLARGCLVPSGHKAWIGGKGNSLLYIVPDPLLIPS